MNYKVIGFTNTRRSTRLTNHRFAQAAELKEVYGLPFPVEEIALVWEHYSEDLCASWLVDDQKSIEDAFGVILAPLTPKEVK